ncbi:MAG: hypothetical protein KIS76_08755 [Pyrinomonadaceae bacterium]|nr:hypothetical protein [Pyrinomonadaceae bacterium]
MCVRLTALAAELGFDVWTTADGLPQNSVNGIVQTPDGYLWLATYDGLARFDGVRFTIFDKGNSPGIINNRFVGIYADRAGAVWAFTESGILTLYREGVFESYETPEGLSELIREISEDEDNRLIIATHQKLYYFKDGKFIPLPAEKQREPIKTYSRKPDSVWIMKPGSITHKKNGGETFYSFDFRQLRTSSVADFTVNYFPEMAAAYCFEDSHGALWVGRVRDRLYRLRDGEVELFTAAEIFGSKIQFDIAPILEDEKGNIWLSLIIETPNYTKTGLVKYDGGNFELSKTEGVAMGGIIDRENNLWLTTIGSGLMRLQKRTITTLSVKDGLAGDEVYPLIQTRSGDIYIGTMNGVNLYQNGKLSFLEKVKNPNNQEVSSRGFSESDNGELYISYYGGFGQIKSDLSQKILEKNVPSGYTDFDYNSDGSIWLANEEGLIRFQHGQPTEKLTVSDGLPHNKVITLYKDRNGVLWIGTAKGLSRLKDGKFTNYGADVGMPEDFIRDIYEDADGTLWIGTYSSGLVRYKDGKFFRYTVENGLFNNGVFAIVEDERGNFWMSCNRGIYRVGKKELNDLADGKIAKIESVSYGLSDGMLNTEANGGRHPSAIKAKDGKIWFPTMGGVAIVDPNAETFNPKPPPVVIENISIDRKKMDAANVYAANHDLKNVIEMQPGQTSLEIDYTGLSLVKSDQIKFKYKLEGLEENWVDGGALRSANYSYLPHGEYTFRVIAANANGVWNEQGAAIRINVLPFYYETWWFRILSVLALALIIGFIYYSRVSHLRKIADAKTNFSRRLIESQENDRKRIANELHDGLGQNLVVIKNRAMLGIRKGDDPERVLKELNEISESAVLALEEVREITGNLRPQLLDRLGLTKALIAMCKQISGVIELESDIASIDGRFSENEEINIYRIVQESLNNVLKHSGAKIASVKISRSDSSVSILIEDNGNGFDADTAGTTHGGLGLVGLRERVDLLNGELKIDSKIGEGTKIRITILRKPARSKGL